MFSISSNDSAIIPLKIKDGYTPAGIEGATIQLQSDNGCEQMLNIPAFEGAPCLINHIDINGQKHRYITLSQKGDMTASLNIEAGNGFYWLIITAQKPIAEQF